MVNGRKMAKLNTSQNIFHSGLQAFCTKFLVIRPIQPTPAEIAQVPALFEDQKKSLFEQLLLFDKISFKVDGENVPLAFMLNAFGEKAFEELIEQDAIRFVSWTPLIAFVQSDVPGVNALVSGTHDNAKYVDPEASVELGFRWMKNPPIDKRKKELIKKIAPLYSFPKAGLAGDAVETANSAFNSGKLAPFGISAANGPLTNLPIEYRKKLCKCATELAEYRHLLEQGMTSYSAYEYYSFFSESVKKFGSLTGVPDNFTKVARLEGFPDLKAISSSIEQPLVRLPTLRAKPTSQKFRSWLASKTEMVADIAREYVNAIVDAKGVLDSPLAKIAKSVVMVAAGAGLGATLDIGLAGTILGGILGPRIVEPIADVGLDLADKFLFEGFQKGWTPRLFFDDLRKLDGLTK